MIMKVKALTGTSFYELRFFLSLKSKALYVYKAPKSILFFATEYGGTIHN